MIALFIHAMKKRRSP